MKVHVTLEPDSRKFSKWMEKFIKKFQGKGVEDGLLAAATPMFKDLVAATPVSSGRLRRSMDMQILRSKTLKSRYRLPVDQQALIMGPLKKVAGGGGPGRRGTSHIAWFLEYGVSAHAIPSPKTQKQKGRTLLVINGSFVSKPVRHPGVRATQFMQKAMDKNIPLSDERFKKGLSNIIDLPWGSVSWDNV
jgi:hypothetical protein